jgi:hypothetical protein
LLWRLLAAPLAWVGWRAVPEGYTRLRTTVRTRGHVVDGFIYIPTEPGPFVGRYYDRVENRWRVWNGSEWV